MAKQLGSHDVSEHLREAYARGWQEDDVCFRFTSCTTPEGRPSVSVGCLPPALAVPIIFVPGIMGSNLKAKADISDGFGKAIIRSGAPTWRVDSKEELASEWVLRKKDQYQLRFQGDKVAVDDRGSIHVDASTNRTPISRQSEAQARARGWGTVSAEFYGGFLDWLDNQLNGPGKLRVGGGLLDNTALASLKQTATKNPHGVAKDKPGATLGAVDLDILLKVDNPVHAFGYNWLQSNLESGAALSAFIDKTIAQYNKDGRICKRVILVTHSMGGLVARAACIVHGATDKVAGVFHGVMPTDGAAASYKSMVAGSGGEPWHGPGDWLGEWVGPKVLGPTGDYVTPALAVNVGPLELLPNARYNQGKPWLRITDIDGKVIKELPKAGGDPYQEIYLEQACWWRLLNVEWLNPAGLNDTLLERYGKAIDKASSFHMKVQAAGDFHPNTHAHYGLDSDHLTYATVTWKLAKEVGAEQIDKLQRFHGAFPINVAPKAGTRVLLLNDGLLIQAQLSDPESAGDGVVPAHASAMSVDQGVKPGNLLVRGSGYIHNSSYSPKSRSEGPAAALQAIVRVLKAEVRA